MLTRSSFIKGHRPRNAGLISIVCILALGVSACGALPSNLADPIAAASTKLLGALTPASQSTETPGGVTPTENPVPATPATGAPADVCALISATEAQAVLGAPVTSTTPGSEPDSVSGGTLNYCTYMGSGGLALLVSYVDLGSAEKAALTLQAQLAQMLADDSSTTTRQESGISDQVYWSTNSHAAQFTVQKGSVVFAVLLGGNLGDPESHKAALQSLAVSVAAKF